MESSESRFTAFLSYVPVIGWIYVIFFRRQNGFAMFHVRQSIGLFLYLVIALAAWIAVIWLLSWIPFGFLAGIILFTIVMVAFFMGLVAWIIGMVNALQGRVAYLPIFGSRASQLPV